MKKVQAEKSFKSMNGHVFSATRQQLNAEVWCEINSNKLDIDKTVFAKTKAEHDELRKVRKDWKKNPVRDKDVVDALTKARTPRWNITVGLLAECA